MIRNIPKKDYKEIEKMQKEMYIPDNDKFTIHNMSKRLDVCKICKSFEFGYFEMIKDDEDYFISDGICIKCHLKYLNKLFLRCYICFDTKEKAYLKLDNRELSIADTFWPRKYYCKKCVKKAMKNSYRKLVLKKYEDDAIPSIFLNGYWDYN